MKLSFWALICGILFGFGLNLVNLLDPHAIQAFLDVEDNGIRDRWLSLVSPFSSVVSRS